MIKQIMPAQNVMPALPKMIRRLPFMQLQSSSNCDMSGSPHGPHGHCIQQTNANIMRITCQRIVKIRAAKIIKTIATRNTYGKIYVNANAI